MSKRRILQDHVKKGNTFYPPFLAGPNSLNLREVEWRREMVPELIWLAPLICDHGVDKARQLANALVCIARDESNESDFLDIGTMSGFTRLNSRMKKTILVRLRAAGRIGDLRSSLEPIFRLYPRCPLRFLLGGENASIRKRPAMEYMTPILWECLHRQEKLPTLVQGIFYDIGLAGGKHLFAEESEPLDTRTLAEYPDTENSQMSAGRLRAEVNSLGMCSPLSFWTEYFWQRGNELGACELRPYDNPPLSAPTQAFLHYQLECFGFYSIESEAIWNLYESQFVPNLYTPLRNEILLGLATRIYRLTVQVVGFLPNWIEDIGQVFVRMAVESYIYWTWLKAKGEDSDFESFYEHGLGQQKLHMEHINNYLADQNLSDAEMEDINSGLEFLKRHKIPALVPVNLGKPLEKSLRQLAKEADLEHIYDLVFTPTSSMVHGMYDTLERYYLRECVNPFHGLHRVPFYWAKSEISGYGAENTLQITDWVLADMLSDVGAPVPDEMPGEKYFERLNDDEAYNTFVQEFEDTECESP